MQKYNPQKIEGKWQKEWDKSNIYKAEDFSKKKKFYCLIEFPYPSGAGLHVGHLRSHIAIDIVARKKRMDGYNVMYPIGWDAFGLPTENFAIKTKTHPKIVTKNNIKNFTRQIKSYGPSFDWSREINTTDPKYYKWTQWIFLKLFNSFYDEKSDKARDIKDLDIPKNLNDLEKREFIDNHRLAYETKMAINWCPSCKIGLANEEVVNNTCERCGAPAEKKTMRQWMLRITKYAERLIKDLDTVDYLDKIKTQQVNWIGRSEGATVKFAVKTSTELGSEISEPSSVEVFTTRPDTLFGCTYMVLSPEHNLIKSLESRILNLDEVQKYVEQAKNKSDLDRTDLAKEKTGVELKGIKAINPVNNEEIPIWVADYVLASYGTGAIMSVPAHDERDFEFAKKFGLEIKCVVDPIKFENVRNYIIIDKDGIQQCRGGTVVSWNPQNETIENGIERFLEEVRNGKHYHIGKGKLINSDFLNGLTTEEAKKKITKWLEKNNFGKKATNYKLRDWVFSRQHYWGEPIPIVKCEKCGNVALEKKDLPLELPEVKNYEPTDTGKSPLAKIDKWVNVKCPKCGKSAKRETDTMPNWAGSSWYYLRYLDSKNNQEFASQKNIKHWMPVDLYNGGMEHTTLHLLYSRFWHKFLYDLGFVNTAEPYKKRRSHGMILAEDGQKMSKSRGNTINPDEVIRQYGADTVRLYEMFMGPYSEAIPWNTNSLVGMSRFLERVCKLQIKVETRFIASKSIEPLLHKTIKKVTEDIDNLKFNTAISQLMIFLNSLEKEEKISATHYSQFLILLSPFAPHITEELWEMLGNQESIHLQSFPKYNLELIKEKEITLVIQINGKLRDQKKVPADISEENAKKLAFESVKIKKWIENKEIRKVIFVKERLVNIVI
ncbi:MAG: class I tRNA ligase family protein [Patescibacteria group bacterium]|nr:class I tRNA ligase family protein [Patescibacteria group bacterium]